MKEKDASKDLAMSFDFSKELESLSPEERTEIERALKEDLQSNLENEEPEFPQIRVLHSAGLFEFPDKKKEESFIGQIIEILPARAWWREPPGKETVPPTCYSFDWLRPDPEVDEPQAKDCRSCKWNKWGSALDSSGQPQRGKACRMRKRVFIRLEGHEIPYLLSVSPVSLRSLRDYLVYLSDKRLPKNAVMTRFSLSLREGGSQIYSIVNFALERKCSLGEFMRAREMKEAYLKGMRRIPIITEEFLEEQPLGKEKEKEIPEKREVSQASSGANEVKEKAEEQEKTEEAEQKTETFEENEVPF